MAASHDQLSNPAYWRQFAPAMHIADSRFLKPEPASAGLIAAGATAAENIHGEGYTQLGALDLGADCAAMAGVARKLSAEDIDPVFVFVYDEFWRPFFRLDALYRHLLGPYTFLPNFWAWDVDPRRGGAGWGPHRDRGAEALFEDGTPKSLTTWIALSEATPLNGCLYIVPAPDDPTYGTPQDGDWRFSHASIRALPAKPGDVLMWNQAVMHWGGRSSPRAAQSRVSLSMEAQRLDVPSVEAPLIAPGEVLPFEARLKLIGQKILHYKHMRAADPVMDGIAARLAQIEV